MFNLAANQAVVLEQTCQADADVSRLYLKALQQQLARASETTTLPENSITTIFVVGMATLDT